MSDFVSLAIACAVIGMLAVAGAAHLATEPEPVLVTKRAAPCGTALFGEETHRLPGHGMCFLRAPTFARQGFPAP